VNEKRIRLDTIRWLADCLGIDDHEHIREIVIRPTEVIVRRFSGGKAYLCEHPGTEPHVATIDDHIKVADQITVQPQHQARHATRKDQP
jgi:hypothetical protein